MTLSALISIILLLVVLGFGLYLLERFIPMAEPIKLVIRVVIILCLVLFLLTQLGIWNGFSIR
jgi:hypothetical protein